jgi:hypothetical protein
MADLKQDTSRAPSHAGERFFMRFTRAQRYMHAVLFTTFLGLAATGLPMRFSESFWARRFASGIGGFGTIIFFHKFFAVGPDRGLSHPRERSLHPRADPS